MLLSVTHRQNLERYKDDIDLSTLLERPIESYDSITEYDYTQVVNRVPHVDPVHRILSFTGTPRDVPIYACRDFQYGRQINGMTYLTFYDFCMVDIDDVVDFAALRTTLEDIFAENGLAFRLYRTYRGAHLFITNKCISFREPDVYGFLLALGCDELYAVYSVRYGFRVRMSKKATHPSTEPVRTFVCQIGPVLEELSPFVEMIDSEAELSFPPHQSFRTFIQAVQYVPHDDATTQGGEAMERVAAVVRPLIQKPQRCLRDTPDFYVAEDLKTGCLYVCYYQLAMVDVDGVGTEYEQILREKCDRDQLVTRLIKSQRGYHVFFVDKPRAYAAQATTDLLTDYGCDIQYTVFAYLRGFCVRTCPKHGLDDPAKPIYQDLGLVGALHKVDPYLNRLVDFHLSQVYDPMIVYHAGHNQPGQNVLQTTPRAQTDHTPLDA